MIMRRAAVVSMRVRTPRRTPLPPPPPPLFPYHYPSFLVLLLLFFLPLLLPLPPSTFSALATPRGRVGGASSRWNLAAAAASRARRGGGGQRRQKMRVQAKSRKMVVERGA